MSGDPPSHAVGGPRSPGLRPLTLGVLALQGDVVEHLRALEDVGASSRPVRRPGDLEGLDGIVLPGGESTTLSMLLESSGLFEPLGGALEGGLPAFGTCAGLLLLARELLGGRPDQRTFGVLDCSARRNAYGRQAESFEACVDSSCLDEALAGQPSPERGRPLPAVFIRAPAVEEVGEGVEVLASLPVRDARGPAPVVCRQGQVLATAFHPELTADRRLHRLFAALAAKVADGELARRRPVASLAPPR